MEDVTAASVAYVYSQQVLPKMVVSGGKLNASFTCSQKKK